MSSTPDKQCSAVASVPLWIVICFGVVGFVSLLVMSPLDGTTEQQKQEFKKQRLATLVGFVPLTVITAVLISYAAKHCRKGWTWGAIPLSGLASILVYKISFMLMGAKRS